MFDLEGKQTYVAYSEYGGGVAPAYARPPIKLSTEYLLTNFWSIISRKNQIIKYG